MSLNKVANLLFFIALLFSFSCREIVEKPTIEIFTLKSSDLNIEISYDSI